MDRQRFLSACRTRGSHALAAACVGAIVSGFYAVAEWPGGSPLSTIFIGMVIGVFIYAFIYVFETLFGPTIDRFGGTIRAVEGIARPAGSTVGNCAMFRLTVPLAAPSSRS